jgi:hypothetical protein
MKLAQHVGTENGIGKNRDMSLKHIEKNRNIRGMYRGINEFKKGYQSRTDFAKDEKSDLHTDPLSVLNMLDSYFLKLLNVHGVNSVKQAEICTAELLVLMLKHSSFEVEITIEKLKRHKTSGTDQILAELIQVGGGILYFGIQKLINSVWNARAVEQLCYCACL